MWQSAWMSIIHVVGKTFAKGVFIPSGSLETMANVRFAIPTELANHNSRGEQRNYEAGGGK
jgi:hypothetical protein